VVQGKLMKKAQMQQELLVEAMRECTFKPQTNEGERRELLQKLLEAAAPAQGCL
jgi:hypothetical protein